MFFSKHTRAIYMCTYMRRFTKLIKVDENRITNVQESQLSCQRYLFFLAREPRFFASRVSSPRRSHTMHALLYE